MNIESKLDWSFLDGMQKQCADTLGWPASGTAGMDMNEEELKALYALAYNYYENGKYREAMHGFRYLTVMEPHARKHWMGLGASLQLLREYDKALIVYSVAALIDAEEPQVHLQAADCCFALGQKERGFKALDAAEIAASGQEKYQHLISHLALIRQAWSNQDNENKVEEH